ncbi:MULTISPECIES: uridine diphosphate-N-acetylglucosamine-binding protein YvcK [unclassified Brenneria]|uniref:uridine diphosphate-N-acetylglucosamine-binding protein YvcK n=1 Tax=unclassified Brenneria TaxID=2634434 RepID=UPI0015534F72|nr:MULTISPECIES: uridine diphosphate-N-acetylglucosamine-binding protein YvcK [unclassified Brenneria]MBJ7221229.1 uridine diphosphate-N-acetylglucosamine-binding protein YvcK [Brenneria sp. L3-3C-1]MEE3642472.1 uridine diphosphate-N-acetylglucosamine-binding protein YvcK [Brenneria sp. L3_3C_1]MEE3650164.1 uridine diphosphate-N-acetylglucosamine-binding protein YvcK [Brenneria sp. HEZEL_4_2_4]NPD00122.1 uridine diphosphate-N-acetylglucosamine-binding protein YvcK [Brenneria sp. hezel4-2-4]
MRNRTLADLDRVVALGGGHGLGRVMSSLSSLGPRLTGIVTTTDNGGSTGRIRRSEGGIAWGDTRNCLNQLITTPSVASAMFEYRFNGSGELAGHNLGNLMLKALDHLSVRPLEAINLLRNLLKVDAFLIPMSEQPVDLMAIDEQGNPVYGEVDIDQLPALPRDLTLFPAVEATHEALDAIAEADLILIGPGSFLTSLMPLLLLNDLTRALRRTPAPMVYIGNLGHEQSNAAARLMLAEKLTLIEQKVGKKMIDAVIVGPKVDVGQVSDRLIIQQPLEAADVPHHHDRQLLRQAIEHALQKLGSQARRHGV